MNDIQSTYMSLFPDDTTRCAPGAPQANNSRLAYLVHLKELIQKFEGRADVSAPTTLQTRRPDLLTLKLDDKSTRQTLPKVRMVLNVLESHAQGRLPAGDTLRQAVAENIYQANVPFHHAWELVKATLAIKQLPLWDILHGTDTRAFDGATLADQHEATMLCSGFSPQLQQQLLEARGEDAVFYKTYFHSDASDPLSTLGATRKLTKALGLTRRELRRLLAVNAVGKGNTSVTRSRFISAPDIPAPSSGAYGAAFINNDAQTPLYLTESVDTAKNTVRIPDLTTAHLDRLQRILRLQRALELGAVEADTLVMAALKAEGQKANDYHLTRNTLRALGLFRHLQQQYGVTASQYAALVHEISPFATDRQASFYDKLFAPANRDDGDPALAVLTLDNGEFDHRATEGADGLTVTQLATALKVNDGYLCVILDEVIAVQQLARPKRSLPVLSACYRIVTLMRLFGRDYLKASESELENNANLRDFNREGASKLAQKIQDELGIKVDPDEIEHITVNDLIAHVEKQPKS